MGYMSFIHRAKEVQNELKANWICEEIVQNAVVREYITRCNTMGNIHEVICDPCER